MLKETAKIKFITITMLCSLLIFSLASIVHADWIFNEIRTALKNKVFGQQHAALEKKHKGRIMSGKGYVLHIKESA